MEINDNLSTEFQAVTDAGPHYNNIKSRDVIIGVFVNITVIFGIVPYTQIVINLVLTNKVQKVISFRTARFKLFSFITTLL